MTPFGENRGGTPTGELPLSQGGRAASQGAEVVEQRLSAFRFLYLLAFFILGFGETGVAKKETEAPPLGFPFSSPVFALHVAGFGRLGRCMSDDESLCLSTVILRRPRDVRASKEALPARRPSRLAALAPQ